MKNLPIYRRPNWAHEGCLPSVIGIAAALACHKGDAGNTQSTASDQSGAQTQGANVGDHSTGNTLNTGTQVGSLNTGTQLTSDIKAGGNITETDDGAVGESLNLVGGVLQGLQNDIQTAQSNGGIGGAASDLQALDTPQYGQSSGVAVTPGTPGTGFSTTDILLAIAGLGAVGMGYLLLRKKA